MMEIGNFQIDLEMRTLQRHGEVVHIGSRAFDILAVIVSAEGRLVTKDALMNAVWPNTIVEENNIQVHLSAVRKVLGAERDLILTVPGRGYRYLPRRPEPAAAATPAQAASARRLPPLRSGLLGRTAEVGLIRSMLRQAHVLTLVGAGGIGKTRLAIEAAHHSAAEFTEPVGFVELAALTSKESVLGAIAEACGLTLPGAQIDVASVAAALGDTQRLLLLDNAEHVVAAVAQIAEALVAANAGLRVLVTSREPLRIMAESVFRVDPLDVPSVDATDADILRSSAVDLFLQRANSLQETVATDDAELRLVSEICRRLDGIPLAIELAAARVAALGVQGVCQRLDDRMAILSGGYRTALPRHQTLRATFDWSFALLDEGTQSVFRRLALFSGYFCFESLCAVVCDAEHTLGSAIGGITDLVAKSLVTVEFEGATAKYRLSESTRAYALEKLKAEGELRELIARHARYLAQQLRTQANAATASKLQQLFDDARATFDWSLSADGDVRTGIELAAELVDALFDAGLVEECHARALQALDALDNVTLVTTDNISEARLRAALAATPPHARETRHASAQTVRQRAGKPREPRESRASTATAMQPPSYLFTT
ncbi:putative ATPase/DNA-binding winged helix-turn-helix (wHTH) protein [Paraburkholderia sp. GAS199]|uniref:ATP-binding protein n=1 Tax=Paraburkholderia sp. GAS199 TaxID=3035126 RepID=UPI003D1CF394